MKDEMNPPPKTPLWAFALACIVLGFGVLIFAFGPSYVWHEVLPDGWFDPPNEFWWRIPMAGLLYLAHFPAFICLSTIVVLTHVYFFED